MRIGIGGNLYFGIDDKTHEIIGIENLQETIDKISELIKTKITPMINFVVSINQEENKNIIKVSVDSGSETPYYYINEGTRIAFIRMGNESVQVANHMLNELILKGKRETFDAMATNKDIKDVSFSILRATFKKETGKDFNEEKDLISFGLLSNIGKLTHAGILFSDQCEIYQSKVVCTRWNGLNKASGIVDAIDDAKYSGNIINLRQNAIDFVKKHSKKAWRKTPNGRINYPEYDEYAILEAITNRINSQTI